MSETLILAASDRLARALREDLNLAERAAGRTVWRTPDVKSLRQWIADVWADSWPSEQLLDGTQMQALWLEAVERDRHGVISATACAREAREAERLAQEYALDLDDQPAYSDEQRAWRGWRRHIAARMRERDWLSSEHLPAIVAARLRDGRIRPPAQVQLAGFERGLPPASQQVLDALAAVTSVVNQPLAANATTVCGYRTPDDAGQMQLVAEIIRRHLAAHSGDNDLPPRIVIALPDPDARRAVLEDALIERVAPALRLPAADDDARPRAPWRWDAAAPLSATPWAAGMSAVLALDATDNPPEAASRLLLGAWTADPARQADAAAIDLALRNAGTLRITARRLVELAPSSLRLPLEQLAAVTESAPRRALPSAWSAHFGARLEAAGWPGVTGLPSSAFQTVQELRRALSALAALDPQTGAIDIARARLWLGELLKRRFEPRAEHAQPVRILAAEDAVGIRCDLLLVVDADAAAFPGPARATPFLPIERQRAAGVPQASSGGWLTHRRAEVAALLAGAREVIVIAPMIDARGGDVLASPLFETTWEAAPAPSIFSVADALAASGPQLLMPATDPVPPVTPAEAISGNTRLFEQYVTAPFFAFCAQRLGIEPLPAVGHGLPAQVQGTLVHAALAGFWDGVRTSAALGALAPADRRSRIVDVLKPLLRRHLPEADYGRMLVRLEAARLLDVISHWLTMEAAREDSFRVVEHERKLDSALAGLPLKLRIDRIEQSSATGALTLIDYKTGAGVDANGWREDHLGAPQLPLYAVLLEGLDGLGEIDDIAFGHVADGAPGLLRWSQWSTRSKMQNKPLHAGDFAAQRGAWRQALEAIVAGFLAGHAEISAETAARLRGAPLLVLAGLFADDEAAEDAGDTA
jgi:exodeoxyribonuclease-5